jgi:signal transduction histidine kinase
MKNWLKSFTQGRPILQLCVYLLICMVALTFFISSAGSLVAWRFYGTLLGLAALFLINLAWAIPSPNLKPGTKYFQTWAFLALAALLILATFWLSGHFDLAFLVAVLAMQACARLGVWPGGLAFAVGLLAAWTGEIALMGYPVETIAIVERSVIPGVLFGVLLMTLLERYTQQTRRAEALLAELQEANAALETARRKETELAVAEERVRLARDIHDGLGHHLTVLSIQLQAAEKLAARNPQAAAEAIQTCRSEAQAALSEVRNSVAMMRQGPTERRPLVETLGSLVESFGRRTGIRTTLECAGEPGILPEAARETLFRAAQEGLTNAQKHAQGLTQATVRLEYAPGAVRLAVLDDGRAPCVDEHTGTAGFGLTGLRDRAAQLGGSLQSGPRAAPQGGFALELCIPLGGGAHDPRAAG